MSYFTHNTTSNSFYLDYKETKFEVCIIYFPPSCNYKGILSKTLCWGHRQYAINHVVLFSLAVSNGWTTDPHRYLVQWDFKVEGMSLWTINNFRNMISYCFRRQYSIICFATHPPTYPKVKHAYVGKLHAENTHKQLKRLKRHSFRKRNMIRCSWVCW